jgi:hypothetical protein
MAFKIDTKENYTILTPDSKVFDEKLTENLVQKWTELVKEGAANLVVDLQNCSSVSENIMEQWAALHEQFYVQGQSLVFTHLQPEVVAQLSDHEYFHAINITPTMVEAIDIINMEILERDLLDESEDL